MPVQAFSAAHHDTKRALAAIKENLSATRYLRDEKTKSLLESILMWERRLLGHQQDLAAYKLSHPRAYLSRAASKPGSRFDELEDSVFIRKTNLYSLNMSWNKLKKGYGNYEAICVYDDPSDASRIFLLGWGKDNCVETRYLSKPSLFDEVSPCIYRGLDEIEILYLCGNQCRFSRG